MSSNLLNIADSIRQFRESKHLNPTQFARIAGISRASLYNIEGGQHKPGLETLEKIKAAFPDFNIAMPPSTHDEPKVKGYEMTETRDGYIIVRDPKSNCITRIKTDDTDQVEVLICGKWVPAEAP